MPGGQLEIQCLLVPLHTRLSVSTVPMLIGVSQWRRRETADGRLSGRRCSSHADKLGCPSWFDSASQILALVLTLAQAASGRQAGGQAGVIGGKPGFGWIPGHVRSKFSSLLSNEMGRA